MSKELESDLSSEASSSDGSVASEKLVSLKDFCIQDGDVQSDREIKHTKKKLFGGKILQKKETTL